MSRNPYTPTIGVKLTPAEYFQLHLNFRLWNDSHPVSHLPECRTTKLELHNQGVCCLEHTQQCVEAIILEIVGCESDIFIEPAGFRFWYELATERLSELELGIDHVEKWTDIFLSRDDLRNWQRDKSVSWDDQPGFSLHSFKISCKKHGYQPDLAIVAQIFNESNDYIIEYWTHAD